VTGKGVRVKQETRSPEQEETTLVVSTNLPQPMTIHLRIPCWAPGGNVKINRTALPAFASPSSYLALTRVWNGGDRIQLSLPMALHTAFMPETKRSRP
jgi:uncharacterized protein